MCDRLAARQDSSPVGLRDYVVRKPGNYMFLVCFHSACHSLRSLRIWMNFQSLFFLLPNVVTGLALSFLAPDPLHTWSAPRPRLTSGQINKTGYAGHIIDLLFSSSTSSSSEKRRTVSWTIVRDVGAVSAVHRSPRHPFPFFLLITYQNCLAVSILGWLFRLRMSLLLR